VSLDTQRLALQSRAALAVASVRPDLQVAATRPQQLREQWRLHWLRLRFLQPTVAIAPIMWSGKTRCTPRGRAALHAAEFGAARMSSRLL